jgi:hypothetical protein
VAFNAVLAPSRRPPRGSTTTVAIGQAHFAVPGQRTVTVFVPLAARWRKYIPHRGGLHLGATLFVNGPHGQLIRLVSGITIRRAG